MELVLFYKISFVVAALSAASLTLSGKHQVTRGQTLDVFLLSQAAILGGLVSMIVFPHAHSFYIPFFSSISCYFVFAFILSKLNLDASKKSAFVICGYLFLLSLQYLIIGLFPNLDSHVTSGLFGNMVVASDKENFIIILSCIIFFNLYILNRKKLNVRLFESGIFSQKKVHLFDHFIFSMPVAISLYTLGFLYTLSFLIIPFVISGSSFATDKSSTRILTAVSVAASTAGLLMSILFENLPTTPVQIFLLVVGVSLSKIRLNFT
ncbi:metal ABC transporter permease [bacterium]|nr:metal ABC transporter permease [bacterium]